MRCEGNVKCGGMTVLESVTTYQKCPSVIPQCPSEIPQMALGVIDPHSKPGYIWISFQSGRDLICKALD